MILTKLDGDARGGAALSVTSGHRRSRSSSSGSGSKLDKMQPFHPERIDRSDAAAWGISSAWSKPPSRWSTRRRRSEQQEKLAKGKFDLNDFRQQITQMKKMGSVRDLMGKIPGLSQMPVNLDELDADGEVQRIQGIIDSMTPDERRNPNLIDISRRRRIAAGAGVDPPTSRPWSSSSMRWPPWSSECPR